MKKLIALLLLSPLAFTEPKQLVCLSNITAAEEEAHLRSMEGGNDLADKCKNSGFTSSYKIVYLFDTDGLKNQVESGIQATFLYCHGKGNSILQGRMSHTPSIITFKYKKFSVNVDRKTLKAGNGENRTMSCSLEDIDTSENIL